MPFLVDIEFPDHKIADPIKVIEWVALPGMYLPRHAPIFRVSIAEEVFDLVPEMPIVLESCLVAIGEVISFGQVVEKASAEGDEIPYGRDSVKLVSSRTQCSPQNWDTQSSIKVSINETSR